MVYMNETQEDTFAEHTGAWGTVLRQPHIIATIVISLGAVLGSLAYVGTFSTVARQFTSNSLPTTPSADASLAAEQKKLNERDENNNNIPDWQELSLATDTVTEEGLPSGGSPNVSPSSATTYTKTELLAGSLFGTYFERKETDSYSTADNGSLVADALSSISLDKIPSFTVADITTTRDEGSAAVVYKESVGKSIAPLAAIKEYELSIYAKATEQNDVAEFTKLAAAGEVYASTVESLRGIAVPEDAARAHIALMNGFAKLSLSLHEMAKGYDDVAASYTALKYFGEAEKEIERAYTLQEVYLARYNAL
jgi:hypothetical protein